MSTVITDDIAENLRRDDRSVGLVETRHATLFEPPNELVLACGAKLGPIRIAYETYGELSPERDNAVFVCHALTGDAHVAGRRGPPRPRMSTPAHAECDARHGELWNGNRAPASD